MPPCHAFAYNCANTCTSALKKFDCYKFGIGQYAFYPVKLSRFAEKKWPYTAYRAVVRSVSSYLCSQNVARI